MPARVSTLPRPVPCASGMTPDHVDLADRLVLAGGGGGQRRVHLGPVEAQDLARWHRRPAGSRRGQTSPRPCARPGPRRSCAPCSGWWANAAALAATQPGPSVAGSKARMVMPAGHHGGRHAVSPCDHAHAPEFAHRGVAEALGQLGGGLVVPVRPGPQGTQLGLSCPGR